MTEDECGQIGRRVDALLNDALIGQPAEPPSTSASVNAYLAGNLTLARMRRTLEAFERKQATEDADVFVRLGDDGYQAYRILKHGGLVLVGGHERGGSLGPAIVAKIQCIAPGVRVQLTQFIPDGSIALLGRVRAISRPTLGTPVPPARPPRRA